MTIDWISFWLGAGAFSMVATILILILKVIIAQIELLEHQIDLGIENQAELDKEK